jgi:hypothetical protein
LHDARAVADHEPAGGLLGDRSRECGKGQGDALRTRFAGFEVRRNISVRSWGEAAVFCSIRAFPVLTP